MLLLNDSLCSHRSLLSNIFVTGFFVYTMKSVIIMRQILLVLTSQAYLAFADLTDTAPLPIIDLGVSLIQATRNALGVRPILSFTNIRYAQPPINNLRFAAPVAPKVRNSTINDGKQAVICPQANPGKCFSL